MTPRNRGVLYGGIVFFACGAILRSAMMRGGLQMALDMMTVGCFIVGVASAWWVWNWCWKESDEDILLGRYSVQCKQCHRGIKPGEPFVDSDSGYYCSIDCNILHHRIKAGTACAQCHGTAIVICEDCGKPCCVNPECMYCPQCDYDRSQSK